MGDIIDISFKNYRAITDFISVSELKLFSESPYLYKQKMIEGKKEKNKEALMLGTLMHALLLEPHKVDDEFLVYTKLDARTSQGKLQQEMLKTFKDKTPISTEIYENATEYVLESKRLLKTLCNPKDLIVEKSFFYEGDAFYGLKVKARFDSYLENKFILDYKTISASPTNEEFTRTVLKYKYHWQAAFYLKIYKEITGEILPQFYWLVQSTVAPFACQLYEADQELLKIGELEFMEALAQFKEFKEKDHFPRMFEEEKIISLPPWYSNKFYFKTNKID